MKLQYVTKRIRMPKIWLHDLSMEIDDSVIIPMIDEADLKDIKGKPYAICTDYPHLLS